MNNHLLPYPYNQGTTCPIWDLRRPTRVLYDAHVRFFQAVRYSPEKNPIRIICISDTHNATPEVPDGDLLVHAGDLTKDGTSEELQAQLRWLSSLPHTHKVVIAGNHDLLLDSSFAERSPTRLRGNDSSTALDLDWGDIIYLQSSSVTLEFVKWKRKLKIYGSPLTPEDGIWAFQYPAIRDVWTRKVPNDTDIVIAHSPPALYRAASKGGDGYLLRELRRERPSLVVFGHAHDGYGEDILAHDGVQCAREEIILQTGGLFAMVRMLAWMIIAPVRRMLCLPLKVTKLVNAALAPGSQKKDGKVPIVLEV